MAEKFDVIVLGAGLAGLAAANNVAAAGKRVVVLEARDRVGGRLKNGTLEDGQWIELGGQWIGPTQDRMYELVEELGLKTITTYNAGSTLIQLGPKPVRMSPTKGAVPRLNPFVLADLAQGLLKFEKLTKSVDLQKPWATSGAYKLDYVTFQSWITKNLKTPAARSYFQVASEAVFAAEPGDLSLLHAAFYAKSGSGLETLMAVDRGAQQDRIDGGSVLIAEKLAEKLAKKQANVLLNSPVRAIKQTAEDVTVKTRAGKVYTGEQVIVTLPPTLAGRLEYDPPLPGRRDQLTQRLPMGQVIKMFLVYERPFWRDHGLNGQVGSAKGPVKVTFDNTPPGAKRAIMLGFLEGNEGRKWSKKTAEERKEMFIKSLVGFFGEEARHPIDYLDQDWADEEFSRGCYGAHFTTGTWTAYGEELRQAVGRVHWAGTEYSPVWNGYMEGAVRSGESTAAEVLAALAV